MDVAGSQTLHRGSPLQGEPQVRSWEPRPTARRQSKSGGKPRVRGCGEAMRSRPLRWDWVPRLPPPHPIVPEGNRPAFWDTGFTVLGAAKPNSALHVTGRALPSHEQGIDSARPARELRVRPRGRHKFSPKIREGSGRQRSASRLLATRLNDGISGYRGRASCHPKAAPSARPRAV
jgi:hypothetical protein